MPCFGELAALARKHVNLKAGEILIELRMSEMTNGKLVFGPLKSEAGVRVATVPSVVMPALEEYLAPEIEKPGWSNDSYQASLLERVTRIELALSAWEFPIITNVCPKCIP